MGIPTVMASLIVLGLGTILEAQTPGAPPAAPASNALANVAAANVTNAAGGKIQFATLSYDFGKVKSGDPAKYTFLFTNAGEQVLEIRNVQACGCIALGDWTKKVEPGRTGVIPIRYNSAGFPSGPFAKTITVSSSDKAMGIVSLLLKGTIWRPVDVNPPYANFNVPPDAQSASGFVTITNNTDEPLYLSEPQCNNPLFNAQLKTNHPGWGYQVVITRVPPMAPGAAQTQVTLKTSSTNPPLIAITAWANVQPPLVVLPQQLTLNQAPLSNTQPFTITIQNFTTNALVLSEPVVTAEDVKVQLRELVQGRLFNALLTFPPGFEIARGQPVEFRVKSSNPKFPLIKVPVLQVPRPPKPPSAPVPSAAQRLAPPVPVPPQPVVRQMPPRPAAPPQ